LEHFGNRQILISESWQTWQTNITVEKEFKVRWEMNITESTRVSVYTTLCCAFMSVKTVTLCFSVNALQLHCVFVSEHSSYIMFLCLCNSLCCAFVCVHSSFMMCFCVCALQLDHHLVSFTAVTLCFHVFVLQLPCVFIYVHCSYIVFLCLVSVVVLVPFEDNIVKH